MARYKKVSLTEQRVKTAELATVDQEAYKERCKLEGQRFRQIRTYKDVVDLNEWALNSLISGHHDVKTVCAIGYMSVVSLQAIKLAKTESNPEEQLSEKLRQEELNLDLTDKEMKSILTASNVNIQINVLNKAAERPKAEAMLAQEYLSDSDIPTIVNTALRSAGKLARGTAKDEDDDILEIQPMRKTDDSNDES